MDTRTITIALSAAAIAAVSAGTLTKPNFDEMAAEVDRVRSAEARALSSLGKYREAKPETAKVLAEVGLGDKALQNCWMRDGRAVCLLDGSNEVQLNAAQSARLATEIEAMRAEEEAAKEVALAEATGKANPTVGISGEATEDK